MIEYDGQDADGNDFWAMIGFVCMFDHMTQDDVFDFSALIGRFAGIELGPRKTQCELKWAIMDDEKSSP